MARSAIILAAHTSLCSNHIYKAGTPEQHANTCRSSRGRVDRLLVADGAGSGLRCGGNRTTAVRDGDHWILNGAKTFTTNAHYARCLRGDGGDRPGSAQPRHFGVRDREGAAGIPHGQERKQDGSAGERHRRSDLSGLRLPRPISCSASEGQGFIDSLKVLDGGRISIAALSIGMAQGAYDAALKYSKSAQAVRPADLGVPGDSVQARRHGDEIDAARLLTYRAAGCWITGSV